MSFQSRHKRRDAALPAVRDELLQAALYDFKSDPEVAGIYLAGSMARENADQYSDIDLHIVVTRESLDRFIANKWERTAAMASWRAVSLSL